MTKIQAIRERVEITAHRIAEACHHYLATMGEFGPTHKYTLAAVRGLRREVGVEWRDMSAVTGDNVRVVTYSPNAEALGKRGIRENYGGDGVWQLAGDDCRPTHWTLLPPPPPPPPAPAATPDPDPRSPLADEN